jgi:hypothetical protein
VPVPFDRADIEGGVTGINPNSVFFDQRIEYQDEEVSAGRRASLVERRRAHLPDS